MRYRRGMFFPCARFQDLFHLREGQVAFILSIVEVWREAHAGFGTVVDEDVPGQEFPANLVGMRAFDRNRPGALGWVFRSVDVPAASSSAPHQARRHGERVPQWHARLRSRNCEKEPAKWAPAA